MRAPAVSFANKLWAATLAALLTFTLVPASALAQGEGDTADASTEESQEVSALQPDASSGVAPMFASGLVGSPTAFVNSDVAFDSEPIIGSFTIDGLTFAVTEGSDVELVGVSPDWKRATDSQEGDGSPVAPMLASGPDGLDADSSTLALPESIAYEGIGYAVTSIGAYAFYLSGVTDVELPASVSSVDDRAFRSSDVSSVIVADGNPSYSSSDGALYDADRLSLLLIPEGKQGTVLLPKTAESAAPSVFSHCPLVTQVSVEEGSAAFASENGLLYDASLTTLLRVPAGATEATVREGCTTIAAGAMEGCAKLERINAPASVTSVSPDVFAAVPTVSLPAVSVAADDPAGASQANEAEASGPAVAQLTAMVALSSADDDLPNVDFRAVTVYLADMGSADPWRACGFACQEEAVQEIPEALTELAATYAANGVYGYAYPSDLRCRWTSANSLRADTQIAGTPWRVFTWTNSNIPSAQHNSTRGYYLQWSINKDQAYLLTPSDKVVYVPSYTWTPPANLPAANRPSTSLFVFYNTYEFTVMWDANGGEVEKDGVWASQTSDMVPILSNTVSCPTPRKTGYQFMGWSTGGTTYAAGDTVTVLGSMTLTAQWERVEYDLEFDVDSEPGDEGYPGIDKPDETVNVESGPTVIEDPKRPGYVFQGWVIPNTEGTEAIDQDLVYKDEADGKWYVDASKLPDYANDDGRVELTARWTSVISVDVPSAVTFYADVVTQGNESREGAASSAFGQNKVASQSEVDLRIVGLESTAVETQGSTLGADSILKKSDAATPSSSTQKLFSLYPTDKALAPDDLQDPDAVSTTKPSDAVDFALDDLLLEKSFASDKFTIPAGDTLNLGYRLNLAETGTELDYDKLSTLDEGTSASIANISYCFAADALPSDWGEPLWIENPDRSLNPAKYLLLDDIKAAAEDLSANGESSAYYSMYKGILDRQVTNGGNPGVGPYFQLKVEGAQTGYLDLQLIGICQDIKSNGAGKAGLTFQMRDIYAYNGNASAPAGGAGFTSAMNSTRTNNGGWDATSLKTRLNATSGPGAFLGLLDPALQKAIQSVQKGQQMPGGSSNSYLSRTSDEVIWLPSMYEVFGVGSDAYNRSESLDVAGYNRFQYQAYMGSKSAMKRHYASSGSAVQGWWLRSARLSYTEGFCVVIPDGGYDSDYASDNYGLAPAFCL